jgi:hypothetical protein
MEVLPYLPYASFSYHKEARLELERFLPCFSMR